MENTNLPTDAHAAFELSFGLAQADITPPLEIYARNWGLQKVIRLQACINHYTFHV